MDSTELEDYWTRRYEEGKTGWDIGTVSRPIKEYIDQLSDKEIKVLIPGAGNAYEAEYLYDRGFSTTYVLDISELPLNQAKSRIPDMPEGQFLQDNFFTLTGQYDLILEQTFFCSFEPTPENRKHYAVKMHELLKPNGKLVGLWFDLPLETGAKRPFGGSKEEYISYLRPYFEIQIFEACYNSIEPRAGKELFGVFTKKGK